MANDEQVFENSYYMIDDVMLCLTQDLPEPEPEPEPKPVVMEKPEVGKK